MHLDHCGAIKVQFQIFGLWLMAYGFLFPCPALRGGEPIHDWWLMEFQFGWISIPESWKKKIVCISYIEVK